MTARAGNPSREGLAVFFAPALVAGLTAALLRAPGVLYADSGELITAVSAHGNAHPPGFPLFLLLGGIWLDLLRADPSQAASLLNLFSSVCLGVVAGATALAVRSLSFLGALEAGSTGRVMAAVAGGLSFALGPTLFDFSLGTEVYALHAAFLACALGSALWARCARSFREQMAATAACGLSFGCGLAVHHATMAVILPGLLVLLFPRERPWKLLERSLVFGLAWLPGLLTYTVLPYRAAQWPPLNWGNPSNLFRFWVHVSARDYQVNLDVSFSQMLERASALPRLLGGEFFVIGLLFAAGGAWWLARKDSRTLVGLLTAAAGCLLLALRYEIAEDQAAYYIPAFLITALLSGMGVLGALDCARLRAGWRRLAMAAVALAFISGFVWTVEARAGRRRDSRAIETARNVLALPRNATVLTPEWNVYAPMLPFRLEEGERKDLFVLDVLLLKRGWYLDTQKLRHGERTGAVKEVFDRYRARISDWEENRPFDADELTRLYNSLNRAFVRAAWREGRPVFWVGRMFPELVPEESLVIPRGLAFEIVARDRGAVYLGDLPLETRVAERPDLPFDSVFEEKIRPLYVLMLTQRARYELAFRRFAEAASRIAAARALSPADPMALELQGDVALAHGRFGEALECYTAAAQNGGDAETLANKSREAARQQ